MTKDQPEAENAIPKDWSIKRIDEVASLVRGRVISHRDIAKARDPQYPVYSSQTANSGIMGYIDTYDFDGEYVTWTTDGENAGTIFYRSGQFNCTNVCGTIKCSSVDHRFLAYALSEVSEAYVSRHVGNPKLMSEEMKRAEVLVPNVVAEQKLIAAAIADTDQWVDSLEMVIEKKNLIFQGARRALLSGARRLPGFEKVAGSKSSEIGPIPIDWNARPAGEIGKFRGGSGFPMRYQGAAEGEYPFFKVSDMNNDGNEIFMGTANNYISEEQRTKMGATPFPKNTIVFAKVGAAIFLERKRILAQPSCIDNNMAAFVLVSGVADIRFVHYALQEVKFGNYVSVTALPSLNGKTLAAIPICTPDDMNEQTAIAVALSSMNEEIDVLDRKLEKARNIRRGMMQQLLTGKVRLV